MERLISMIKARLKNMFPNLYKAFLAIKEKASYKYYESLDEQHYQKAIAKRYKKRINEVLDWGNLKTYNEKMQWAKLYDRNPLKTRLTDKHLVREWVNDKIGEEYLIPLIGVWSTFDEIDFNKLPQKFVLKTNHGTGTNYIVQDKNAIDKKDVKKKLEEWLNTNYAYKLGLEMHYKDIRPKIIAEQYMEDIDGELKDYKFLCFGGEVYYCWVDSGRFSDHRRNVYNLKWELESWNQHTYKNTDKPLPKPKNFDLMVKLAKQLCRGFPHVRVDFYNIDGRIYFGEMTFTNSSGFEKIIPHEYNLMLGDLWELPIEGK